MNILDIIGVFIVLAVIAFGTFIFRSDQTESAKKILNRHRDIPYDPED